MGANGTQGIRPAVWVDMAVFKSELTVPEEQGYGAIDSVLHLVEGVEGNVAFGTYEQDGNGSYSTREMTECYWSASTYLTRNIITR